MQWFQAHAGEVFAILFFISELLAELPNVKSNSIFQVLYGFIKKKHDENPGK